MISTEIFTRLRDDSFVELCGSRTRCVLMIRLRDDVAYDLCTEGLSISFYESFQQVSYIVTALTRSYSSSAKVFFKRFRSVPTGIRPSYRKFTLGMVGTTVIVKLGII